MVAYRLVVVTLAWPSHWLIVTMCSPGHMRDFIRACKGGDPACSNFDVAAPFVEWMLLGVIALRHEGKLEYDTDKMRITNNSDANKLLKPTFRKGWEFHAVKG